MTETDISDDVVVEIVKHVECAELDGEAVLLDVKAGEYYGLNQLGSVVLNYLREPISIANLKEAILQEYQVSDEQLDVDLASFFEKMIEHNLVHVK